MVQSIRDERLPGDPRASDLRRREILAAASGVFRRKGFAATGMREIAAELGMTAGNLYHYFEGKEDLLAFCQETTLDALLESVDAIVALGLPAPESLRRIVEAHLVCLNETFPGSLAHLEVEALSEPRRGPIAAKRRRYERALADVVRAGVSRGELAAAEPRLVTLALLGALNWSVKWFDPDGPRPVREVAADFSRLLLSGLEPRS